MRIIPGRFKIAALKRLASLLRPYLAYTPLIHGDESRLVRGQHVIVNDAIFNLRSGRIVVEDYVFFGHGCMLLTGKHDFSVRDMDRQTNVPGEGRDIHVGRGAWLASDVIVIGPCTVGAHAVVTAGSIVTGNVEAGCIYAGSPAKKVREIRFRDDPAVLAGEKRAG